MTGFLYHYQEILFLFQKLTITYSKLRAMKKMIRRLADPEMVLRLIFLTVNTLLLTFASSAFSQSSSETSIGTDIYVQFREKLNINSEGKIELKKNIQLLFSENPVRSIQSVFPGRVTANHLEGMDRTYRLRLEKPQYIDKILKILNNTPEVIYAESVPVYRMFEVSNDPLWNTQYHLSLVVLDSARDIHPGEDSIVIAIIDGGVNYLHEDLQSEIWINSAEDVDGDGMLSPADNDSIDADNNGFLDDVIGWDFVHIPGQGFAGEDDSLADNDPMDFGGHGTHCAGDAAAATANGIGIASVGGNCSIMSIRAGMVASNGFGYIYYSIEGIYYAANNGAKVISMSYGGGSSSQTGQTAIDYATNLGVVCVAAAGNDNSSTPQYPANYNHVLAVAATEQQDQKAPFSNFGPWIDVSAPGVDILSTSVSGNYSNMSGTSMSTPIVAGLAGLTYSMFPHYTADSVINRIKNSCDNIDALNPAYAGQLGAGRINAFKTLDKVIRLIYTEIDDSLQGNNNNRLDFGETVNMIITLKNTFQNASGVTITLQSLHPVLTIVDSLSLLGNLPYGGTVSNSLSPFSAVVGTDSSIAEVPVLFKIAADGNYSYQKLVTFSIGQREILLVNDDETTGSSKISYYTTALEDLQFEYDVWDIQQQGVPGAEEGNYAIIIWYTGEAEQNVLTSAEQQFLQNYLDNAGKLFLTGQNIAYDLVEQQNGIPFFQNYLHASYLNNNSNDFALDGIPGNPVGAGETFIILGSGGANNQSSPDIIQATSPAQAAILYDIGNPNNQAALTVTANYQLVYFAFGWEGINDNGPAKRINVLNRVIGWLYDPATGLSQNDIILPEAAALFPNYPNPFNPETTIPFFLSKSEYVSLFIYNNLGQIVREYPLQKLEPGFHKFSWDGKNQDEALCSSGIYYYRVIIGNQHFTQKMILMR